MPEPETFDRRVLASIETASPGSTARILRVFRDEQTAAVAAAAALAARHALPELVDLAHRGKGASGSIGARPLAAAWAELEWRARDGDAAGCVAAAEAVTDAYAAFRAAVDG
jgi:HPt (histidine-containing phosphotransfer) domain-containing protein